MESRLVSHSSRVVSSLNRKKSGLRPSTVTQTEKGVSVENTMLPPLFGMFFGGLFGYMYDQKQPENERDSLRNTFKGAMLGAAGGLAVGTEAGRSILCELGKVGVQAAFHGTKACYDVIVKDATLLVKLQQSSVSEPVILFVKFCRQLHACEQLVNRNLRIEEQLNREFDNFIMIFEKVFDIRNLIWALNGMD